MKTLVKSVDKIKYSYHTDRGNARIIIHFIVGLFVIDWQLVIPDYFYFKQGFAGLGFDMLGFDILGFDILGFERLGFDMLGFAGPGFNRVGFAWLGFDMIVSNEAAGHWAAFEKPPYGYPV